MAKISTDLDFGEEGAGSSGDTDLLRPVERDEPSWLTTALTRWATALGVFLGENLVGKIDEFLTWWRTDNVDAVTRAEKKLETRAVGTLDIRSSIHEEIAEELDEAHALGWPYSWIMVSVIQFKIWTSTFGVWLQGIAALRARQVNADLHPSMLPMETFIRFLYLNPDKHTEIQSYLEQLGLSTEQQAIAIQGNRAIPSLQELITLRNRDKINDVEFGNALRRSGFNNFDAENLAELRHWYPSPQDLVMLAGRDQFEEDTIRTFNLQQDYPDELTEAGAKAGFPEYWLRKFWGAHWRNPSINQAFEMLHRGVLTDAELNTFYDLDDISPFFRNKLKAIAYRVYNRVDIRRMLNTGVMNPGQVFDAYKELGYNDDKAGKMRDFSVKLKEDSERELTRSQVEKLYDYRQINKRELVDYYEILGYTREQALKLGDLKEAVEEEKRLNSFIARAEFEYKRNLIDRANAAALLGQEGMKGTRLRELFDEWDNEAAIDKRLPRIDDVLDWRGSGQIDEEQFRDYLRRMNFSEDDIHEYIKVGGERIAKTDAIRFFNRWQIDEPEFREYLENLGYSDREVELFVIQGNAFRERNPIVEPVNGSG